MDVAVQSLELHLNIIRKDIIIHYLDHNIFPAIFAFFFIVITMIMSQTGCQN